MPTSNLYNYENKIRCPCLLINLYRRPPPKKKLTQRILCVCLGGWIVNKLTIRFALNFKI